MSVVGGCLTANQGRVWRLYRKGLSQTEIASKLGVTRQAIHKTLDKAHNRVLKALLDTAQINKLDITKVNPAKGFLIGYSPGFRCKVFLIYGTNNGVQMWYEHQGQCEGCRRHQECTQKLLETAKEWEIELTDEEARLSPTLLAERLFSGVVGTK